ncbi:hypothetical protein LSAT2_031823 [Lamellibrachia satsuma]|nr:hypothetical protein LSAT2_031823 [Lamellibrachia satsuma]
MYPTEDVTVPAYAPTYHSARRSMYPPPDITVSRRVRYAYRENSPELDAVPAYTLNRLRVRTTDARNKMDAHRTLLDRYMPETFGAEQDVASAVLYKYGELVDRARRLGHRSTITTTKTIVAALPPGGASLRWPVVLHLVSTSGTTSSPCSI